MRMSTTMQTGNRFFDFANPESHDYCLIEIATALSKHCRYNGHCNGFYSVAQHSVYVCDNVDHPYKFQALMHDAAEAYTGDIVTPLKQMLPEFKKIEHRIEQAIYKYYDLPEKLDPSIKEADTRMLLTEKRDIMPEIDEPGEWKYYTDNFEPYNHFEIKHRWEPVYAKDIFIHYFLAYAPEPIRETLTVQIRNAA